MTPEIKKALKLVQEALESMQIVDFSVENLVGWNKAIAACRKALAAPPVLEPVGKVIASVPHLRSISVELLPEVPVPPEDSLIYTTQPAQPAQQEPVVQNICIKCANADSWGLPDKPVCRSCVGNSEWKPLNKSSVKPITPPAAQPAVPDAITDSGENPDYRAGWNECRETMLQILKARTL